MEKPLFYEKTVKNKKNSESDVSPGESLSPCSTSRYQRDPNLSHPQMST
jgi:hypothetical protein